MGPEPVFRPVLLPLCRRCRSLPTLAQRRPQPQPHPRSDLHPQNRPRAFISKPPQLEKKPKTFSSSLRGGGVVGESLSGHKTQAQSLLEMQRKMQRQDAGRNRNAFQISGSYPMSPGFLEATRSAEVGMANRPSTTDALGNLHHLHVYSTKHNTHVTLTKPNREPMLSLSAGNINFKQGHRGSFDAAYQLVTYSITQIIEKGFVQKIHQLELILRGHGPGREAFQKVLLGSEGRLIKPLVARVTDATRLKFGGTRSPNLRRL